MGAGAVGVRRNRGEHLFFGTMAALILLTVFVGFARSYFLSPWLDAPPGLRPMTPLIHFHGAVFTSWILLLFAQTGLVAGGRTDLHRKLGVFGAVVAGVMVLVGTLTAVHGAARGAAPPGIEPRQFLAIPFFDMIVFGALVTAGIRARRDPQTHKRFMLLATIGILTAAIARWPLALMQGGPLAFFGITDLYLLPLVGFDLATRGRIHHATLIGAVVIVISQPLRLAVSGTGAWLWFADWAVSLVT